MGVYFNGTNSYGTIPAVLNGLNIFSIKIVIQTLNTSTDDYIFQCPCFIGFDLPGAGTRDFSIRMQNGNAVLLGGLSGSDNSVSGTTINDGNEHIIGIIADGTNVYISIDGNTYGSIPVSKSIANNTIYLGWDGGNGVYAEFILKECAIWNTNITISQLNSTVVTNNNLLVWYKCNETINGTTTLLDYSNNSNSAIVYNCINAPISPISIFATYVSNGQQEPYGIDQYTKSLLHFNGNNLDEIISKEWMPSSYITVPSSVLGGKQVFTIKIVCATNYNRTQNSYWNAPTIVGTSTDGTNSGDFAISLNQGQVHFWAGLGYEGSDSIATGVYTNDGNFHEYILQSTGSVLSLFIDGVQCPQTTNVSIPILSSQPICIGNALPSANYQTPLILKEAQFWSVVKNPSDISSITGAESGLEGYYVYSEKVGTNIPDKTINKRDATEVNPFVYSDSIYKFSKSLYFDGNTNYLVGYNSKTFDLSTQDFSIDWWEYRLTTNSGNPVFCIEREKDYNGDYNASIVLGWVVDGYVAAFLSSNGSSWDIGNSIYMGDLLINQWVHRAIVRKGSYFYFFQNGVLCDIIISSIPLYYDSTYRLILGTRNDSFFNGYIDEFRISVGIARWTNDFSLSTSEYISKPTNIFESGCVDISKQTFKNEYNYSDLIKIVYLHNFKNLDMIKSTKLKQSYTVDMIKLLNQDYSIIKGTTIASEIRAYSNSIPSLYSNELLGGYKIVNNTIDRNSIPYLRRLLGMKCMVLSNNNTYILINNPNTSNTSDSDWKQEIIKSTDLFINNDTVEDAINSILNNANTRYIKFSIPTNTSNYIGDEFVLPFNCNITSLNINVSTDYILSDMINAQLEKYNINTKSWDIILPTYITKDNPINNKTTILSIPYNLIIGDRIRINVTNIQSNIIILNSTLSILLTE